MATRSIFYNGEPRLRAGWRLLIQSFLLSFLTFCAFFPFAFAPRFANTAELFFLQVAAFFGTTLSILLARRFLDKRTFVSLGIKMNGWAFLDLLTGIIITFLMMALIFIIQWAAGWVTFDSYVWQTESFSTVILETFVVVVTFFLVGWNEELLSRGYHLQTLESGLNTFWAVVLSSAVFSILHFANPNAESTEFIAVGLFLAGVFLAFGYLRTRQLWLPIGLHIGWNFFEGFVFGFPVSGIEYFRLILITVDGPEFLTGGRFGPEAGLVLIPGMVLGFALVYLYTRGRNMIPKSQESRVTTNESHSS
jgi:membrane protease YdiL (CAAX protease family)